MYAPDKLKNNLEDEYVSNIRINFLENLYYIIQDIIEDKTMFDIDDFNPTYYDEYTLETNCHNDIVSKLYLEINNFKNYKLDTKKRKSDKLIFPELYFSIEMFIDNIYNYSIATFDENTIIWKDDYSVYIKTTIPFDNKLTKDYYFQIIPCITYFDKNNKHGIMYKKNHGIEIEYPEISIKNYNKKNKLTKNVYKDHINIFKNILLQNQKIKDLPHEIIEIILYSVPNEIYKDTSRQTLFNVVNYLRNNPIKTIKTIDEQDQAFSSIYRSLSPIYVKHILRIIEKYLMNI